MKTPNNTKSAYFAIAAMCFIAAPVIYFAYWIYCFYVYSNRSQALANFESALPEFVRAVEYYDIIFVALTILALILGARGISHNNSFWHNLSLIISLLSGLLAFIYLLLMLLKYIA
jgi:hypothetical protein